jgi:WD40 repeat protein
VYRRLAEHDHGVAAVGFSDDELLLATAGYAEDRKLMIWDMTTGNIVTMCTQNPCPTTTITWAGFVKDIKVRHGHPSAVCSVTGLTRSLRSQRRDTHRYLLCTAGAHQIVHWSLDARTGDMQGLSVALRGIRKHGHGSV